MCEEKSRCGPTSLYYGLRGPQRVDQDSLDFQVAASRGARPAGLVLMEATRNVADQELWAEAYVSRKIWGMPWHLVLASAACH